MDKLATALADVSSSTGGTSSVVIDDEREDSTESVSSSDSNGGSGIVLTGASIERLVNADNASRRSPARSVARSSDRVARALRTISTMKSERATTA